MRIVITGAAGGIGRSLMDVLGVRHEVTGIIRSTPLPGARTVRYDDKPALAAALAAADCVIHNALNTRVPARDFIAANTALAREILDGALKGNCKLFVYMSSQVVYSTTMPPDAEGYREDQALRSEGADAYTRLKVEGEAMVATACRAAGVGFLILRPTLVMGRGLIWSDQLAYWLRLYVVGMRGRIMNVIALADMSAFVSTLIEQGVRDEIFNFGAANVSSDAYFEALAASIGKRVHFLPGWLARLAAHFAPSSIWFAKFPAPIDCRKLVAVTGRQPEMQVKTMFTPNAKPRRIVARTLDDMRAVQRSGRPFVAQGQSFSSWFNTPPTIDVLSLAQYRGIISLDGDRVTVNAGTPLADVAAYLDEHGLMLPTLSEFAGIAAGTCFFIDVHGSDDRYFALSEFIEAIRYLDDDGNEVESQRGDPRWDEFRARRSGFILTAVTFRSIPSVLMSNRMSWEPDSGLDGLMRGGYRRNVSTTIQWYPGHAMMLVYNINEVAGPVPGAAPSLAPFRGLHYYWQRLLVAVKLRGRIQVDRAHLILGPWTKVPFQPIVGFLLRHRIIAVRDAEIFLDPDDAIAFAAALRTELRSGAIRVARGQGIGIRFAYDSRSGKHLTLMELVCTDPKAHDRFLALARDIAKAGVTFHRGKFLPAWDTSGGAEQSR
ncbi:MAG: NAD-dependent epimerase/dehydratase family protein [Devosia sp.]